MAIFSGVIKDISSEGLGVVTHPSGMTFFVPGAWPGDAGEFEITRQEKRYGFARWHQLIEQSLDRQKSPCPHLGFQDGLCGGCPWMFVKYNKQLEYKNKLLNTFFKKQKIEATIESIQPAPTQSAFRHRAQLKTDGKQIGYISPNSRVLAPIKTCSVLSQPLSELLESLQQQLPRTDWKPEGKFQWNFIDIDEDMQLKDVQINKRRPFQQANRSSNVYMKNWLTAQIQELSKTKNVLELFCGSGNFTEILSQHFLSIVACEFAGDAADILKNKNLKGVRVLEADIYSHTKWRSIFQNSPSTQILFLDPPREGFKDLALFVSQLPKLERIIYISCDPQSFLMNIKPLVETSWQLRPVQPVDQFPHTPHIELMAVLDKK